MANKANKERKVDNPYEIWVAPDSGWEWRVLKKWQAPATEAKNAYARWFVAVKSPMTFGSFEYGDTYVGDIIHIAKRQYQDPILADDPWPTVPPMPKGGLW